MSDFLFGFSTAIFLVVALVYVIYIWLAYKAHNGDFIER
jgi:hypothetical protein